MQHDKPKVFIDLDEYLELKEKSKPVEHSDNMYKTVIAGLLMFSTNDSLKIYLLAKGINFSFNSSGKREVEAEDISISKL